MEHKGHKVASEERLIIAQNIVNKAMLLHHLLCI